MRDENGIFQVRSKQGRRDTLWRRKTLVMGMQFLRIAFLPPDGYNLKSLKSPKRVKERGNSTWYPKGAAHPHVKTRAKEGRKNGGACCRQIGVPFAARLLRRRNLFRAKTNISADMWYRLTTAQIEFSSHPSILDGDHAHTSWATVIGSPHSRRDLTFHMESRRVVLHDMYMSHDIFSRESARSRKRKLFHMKRKDPILVSRKKIHLSNK